MKTLFYDTNSNISYKSKVVSFIVIEDNFFKALAFFLLRATNSSFIALSKL